VTFDGADETLVLLRRSVRGLLERRWPAGAALHLADDPEAVDRLWREAATMGLTALGDRAGAGGVGAALVVLEELGRAACPLPVLGSLIATAALGGASEDVAGALRQGLSDGADAIAVGFGRAAGERGGGVVTAAISGDAGQSQLHGRVRYVEGLPFCTRVLVAARPGPLLAVVDAGNPALRAVPTPGLAVPALTDVVLDGVPILGAWEIADERLDELVLLARLACTARGLGAAQRAFELALDHARTRQQFGSPTGRFQAVQHRLADCATLCDAVSLLVGRAAHAVDTGADWHAQASAAAAFAGPALRRIARESQHVLAGVGYIEEHEAPRHFRRVHADTLRFGGAPAGRAELAADLLDS